MTVSLPRWRSGILKVNFITVGAGLDELAQRQSELRIDAL